MLNIRVFGRPAPQGSKSKGGAGQMLEASRFLAPWRAAVRLAAMRARSDAGHETLRGPCGVAMIFWMARPKDPKYENYPAGKPDSDKLARAVDDALTMAGVWVDDALAVEVHVYKRWEDGDNFPGATITVWELPA